jgi:predicted alpha/beta-fold hydrolase
MKGKKMQGNRSKIASSNPMLKAKDQPNLNTKKNKQIKEMKTKRKGGTMLFIFSRDEEKTMKPESIIIRPSIT